MSDIAAWLENLGLGKYQAVFTENEIDFEVLPKLTESHLEKMGIPLGPRIKLLEAASTLSEKVAESSPPQSETAAQTSRSITSQAERRQLTVMFVDLVGSTELSGQLDPEDLSVIIRRYQNTVSGEINRLEGFVAKFMGDGVLAYFGWPRAHEDEAERAVRAALAITTEVAKLTAPDNQPLAARIGIDTGQVVVGDLIGEGTAQEETVVGETPNIAARLQALADPGIIVISDNTQQLCGEMFELEPLGEQQLKGVAAPLKAFRVCAERATESRYQAQHRGAILPLVGREHELAQLMGHWQQATRGEEQMVLLSGEAGIGKSRLLRALSDSLAGAPHYRISYQCSPYHSDSALYPAIQQLNRAAGFTANDDSEAKLDKLEALLGRALPEPCKSARLIAALLDIDGEWRYGKLELEPQQQRAQTLRVLIDQIVGLAERQPVLFVLEDAHWIDPTTLEMIERSLDAVKQAPILLLITARPTFEHRFGDHPIVTRLVLNRLSREPSVEIINRLSAGKNLPVALVDEIIRKTDGVPLFVEELTKTVLESGLLRDTTERYVLQGPLENIDIPSSLHDSLMARLDRLQPLKEVAQTAACIGREFSYSLLTTVAGHDEQALRAALEQLVEAELVFQRGLPPEAVYTFKHALLQDAAHRSLLLSRKRELHARIAEALQAQQSALVGAQPEMVARHYSEAELAPQAVRFWQLAGERAAERAAYAEAIGHFSTGLTQLDAIEDERERLSITIKINLGLAAGMRVVDRLDEALEALDRAEAAAEQAASAAALAEVCSLRGNLYFPMGRLNECLAEHERSLQHARAATDPKLETRALGGLGDAYYLRGRMITAGRYFERCIALSLENDDVRTAASYGYMYGLTRYYQNDCEAALRESAASVERAASSGQLRAEMVARGVVGEIGLELGKLEEARSELAIALKYSRRLGAHRFEADYLARLSEFAGFEGLRDKACAMLEQAYAVAREGSILFNGPWILGKLARQTADPAVRRRALQEGEEILCQGCASHCYFHFYRDAIETALMTEEWGEAERYATALEAYTSAEPLPLTDFYIARGRVLATHGRGRRDAALSQELRRLVEEAVRAGLQIPVPALEQALK